MLDMSHVQLQKPAAASRLSGWSYYVGEFTDRLNGISDAFVKNGHTHYPNGSKIQRFEYGRVAADLARYCKAMGCKTRESRISAVTELYQLCSKSDIGFTRKYWWTMGYGKKS